MNLKRDVRMHIAKRRKYFSLAVINTTMIVLAILFGNCSGPSHDASNASTSGVGDLKAILSRCALTGPEQLFEYSYSPFLKTNCASCHIPGGEGKGGFAADTVGLAFDAFSLVGYKRIGQYAVNSGHKSPHTGPQHFDTITQLEKDWEFGVNELNRCASAPVEEFVDDPYKAVRVSSRSIAVNPVVGGTSTLRWSLNSDMLAIPAGVTFPSAPGATFEVEVQTVRRGNTNAYTIRRPKIIYLANNASATDLRIKSLRFELNGKEVINETTFHYVDAESRKNETSLLSAGAMVAIGDIRGSDVMSFSIGEMTAVTLPPPPPSPTVEFSTATATVNENVGTTQVTISLSQAVDTFVTVSYSTATTGTNLAKPSCCATIRDAGGQNVLVKNFDRDYVPVVRDGGTVVFDPLQQQKTIELNIVNDERDEPNENIVLTIDSVVMVSGIGARGTIRTHTLSIVDDDAAPSQFETTFSQLMRPGGGFYEYCLRCHHANSADVLAREYDMTTHSDLLNRQRVVPFNALGSLLWGRIEGSWMGMSVERMPQNGLFDPNQVAAKESIFYWIQSGAKNN